MVDELFPASNQPEAVDSSLDRMVLSLSRDLIDDFPASDPRWMESLPASQVCMLLDLPGLPHKSEVK